MRRTASSATRKTADADVPGEPSLGALPTYLGYALRRTQVALFRDFARRAAAFDITPGQFSLLTLIAANPGISQGALARVHRLDKSTLSPAVHKLAKRGLIRRQRAVADRRYYALSLTDKGATTLAALTTTIERQERVMAAAIEAGERKPLIDMLRQVARALEGGSPS